MKVKDQETAIKHFSPIETDDEYAPLFYYKEDYLKMDLGYARRGQSYYILCDIHTLKLSVLATEPDGSGSYVDLTDELIDLILCGDIIKD